MTSKAIIIREYGKPEVLKLENIKLPKLEKNQILINHTAIGVHFHDVYVRSGLYKTLNLPGIPGVEAVGIVEEKGENVEDFDIGDRVVYITGNYGAYASHRVLDEKIAIKLPNSVSDDLMATNFSRALTVQMLLEKVTKLSSNHKILVTAASGGVGKLLCQAASNKGSLVIGSVSSELKAKECLSYGCVDSLLYNQSDFVDKIMDLTEGKGVDIVFDSVGFDTFETSVEILALCGHLVNFGQSSGPVNPVQMSTLAQKSLTISRPILFHYLTNKNDYKKIANSVFKSFEDRNLIVPSTQPISLENAAEAHKILESRMGGGSLYLKP